MPPASLTHFRPADALTIFRGRPARLQQAVCGEWILYPQEWSATPTCATCRQAMADAEALDVG
jgi:hypothetical protein